MNIAIILSGGVGTRMSLNIPKQYVLVDDQPIINYCMQTFLDDSDIDAIVIGVAEDWADFVKKQVMSLQPAKPVYYAQPGETRQYSIYNALRIIKENGFKEDDIIIIHDAARPLVSKELIHSCIEGCKQADGCMPVIPVKDTIYLSEDGKQIQKLLNRSHLWAGQAPEAFLLGKYLKAHDDMTREELLVITGSTEIAYKSGLNCIMVEGDPLNIKITTLQDLSTFKNIISK